MARKSTDQHQKLLLVNTLKKIGLDNISFVNHESLIDIGHDLRKE
jgi:hypothetical protein